MGFLNESEKLDEGWKSKDAKENCPQQSTWKMYLDV